MSQYMIAAIEKSEMFLVSCMVTFLDRTRPGLEHGEARGHPEHQEAADQEQQRGEI
jgi:hypothetical protein